MRTALLCGLLLVGVAGCQTRHESSAPTSYSPAQQGMMQPQQALTVFVRGDVKNQVIPWAEDLTLARAIVAADYRSVFDPRVILVIRQGQVYKIDPKQLLRGKEDPLLQPGDIVELQR